MKIFLREVAIGIIIEEVEGILGCQFRVEEPLFDIV